MTEVEELLAKQAITEQLYRYCRSVDRLDVPLGRSVFHEDSYADYGPTSYQGPGRDAIDYICKAHLALLSHSHQVTNILIMLNGERAGSEAYVTATLRHARDGQIHQTEVWARYADTWSKRDGIWAIDRRETIIDYDSSRIITPLFAHERARRDLQDLSYKALGLAG